MQHRSGAEVKAVQFVNMPVHCAPLPLDSVNHASKSFGTRLRLVQSVNICYSSQYPARYFTCALKNQSGTSSRAVQPRNIHMHELFPYACM